MSGQCHTDAVHVAVLAGGVGGSRFVRGVRQAYPDAQISVIVNTADDLMLHGLQICPDLDTMMYSLGGGIDQERGWGRADESWHIADELRRYQVEPTWFGLGDRDLATHLVRTQMLDAGYPLSEVTAALCTRWLGDSDQHIRLLPMTDDRVETHIVIDDQDGTGRRAVHFQEYWVKLHADPVAHQVLEVGIQDAKPAPGVSAAIADADLVLVAPSNPVVSVGPILAVPGIRAAIVDARAPVIGFSPILSGAPVLGMAHRLLPAIGVGVDAAAVGLHYGARPAGILDGWIVDDADSHSLGTVRDAGLAATSADLIMKDPATTARFIHLGVQHVTG